MARNMDAYTELCDRLRNVRAEIEKINSEAKTRTKDLVSEEKELSSQLLRVMRTSTEGTIGGTVRVKVNENVRRSATIDRVMMYAPDVADKIVIANTTRKVTVL